MVFYNGVSGDVVVVVKSRCKFDAGGGNGVSEGDGKV